MKSSPSVRSLLILFAVGVLVRCAVLFTGPWTDPVRVLSPDSGRYLALADTLLEHGTFGKQTEDGLVHNAIEQIRRENGTLPAPDANGFYPEVFRTPGYPAYLALFGGTPGLRIALLAQCLLGSLAALAIVFVASELGCSCRAGLLAGYGWALHPAVVTFDLTLLTESLFCSLAWLGLAVMTRRATPITGAVSGFFIGLTALVRPLGLFYLPVAMLLAWKTGHRKWLSMGLLGLAAVAPSALWMVRNQMAGNGLRISTVGEINLYYYGAAYVISENRGDDWFTSWPTRVRELSDRLGAKLQPGEDVFRLARQEALAEFRIHPLTAAKVAIKSQIKLGIDHSLLSAAGLYGVEYRQSGFFSELLQGKLDVTKLSVQSLLVLPWSLLNAAIILLAVIGLMRSFAVWNWRLVSACLIPIALFSAATFPVGLERFRLPMMPFLFILASCAIWPPKVAVTAAETSNG